MYCHISTLQTLLILPSQLRSEAGHKGYFVNPAQAPRFRIILHNQSNL